MSSDFVSVDQLARKAGSWAAFLGVALGAFGAHGLREILETNERVATWETATFYHLIHAVALISVAALGLTSRKVVWLFLVGIFVFSGSLYMLSLTNLRWLGAITPVGGLCFLAGWWILATSQKN